MGESDTRIPKQKRSIEKKQRIKDVAIKLMSEKGYHQTSSNEIAKVAGVSIGTFYSYFKDKKELYKELVADIYNIVLTPMGLNTDNPSEIASSKAPITEIVHDYISMVFKGHEYETAFQREIASLSEQSDEFRDIEMLCKKDLIKQFEVLLSSYSQDIKPANIRIASYVILNTVEANVHDTMFHNGGKNKKAVIDELTTMIVKYLFL